MNTIAEIRKRIKSEVHKTQQDYPFFSPVCSYAESRFLCYLLDCIHTQTSPELTQGITEKEISISAVRKNIMMNTDLVYSGVYTGWVACINPVTDIFYPMRPLRFQSLSSDWYPGGPGQQRYQAAMEIMRELGYSEPNIAALDQYAYVMCDLLQRLDCKVDRKRFLQTTHTFSRLYMRLDSKLSHY